MGRALIGGLLRRGTRPEHIRVGESSESARAALARDFRIQTTPDNRLAIEAATLLIVAVKPQDMGDVLRPLRPVLQQNRPTVVSVAAGIRVSSLESWCGADVPVVRAMPNRPALVGAGATGLFAPLNVLSGPRTAAQHALEAVGETVWVTSEEQLDVVTALSGSGPAYFFLLAELMTQGAIDLGLDAVAARRLAVATLHGSGQLAHGSDGDLERLRAEVTSKGGTTEAAVRLLDSAGLRGIMARALQAAMQRSRELAAQFGAER